MSGAASRITTTLRSASPAPASHVRFANMSASCCAGSPAAPTTPRRQFGSGKTHTLTALYHLVKHIAVAASDSGLADLMRQAGVQRLPQAKVAVFVCNAWELQLGRETPWINLAHQLAGDFSVMARALTTPKAIQRDKRAGPVALRRGAQLPQSPPRHGQYKT